MDIFDEIYSQLVMKLQTLLLVFLVFPVLSQKNIHPCAAAKSQKIKAKSNSLSIAQIAETERYDVHFYDLNLSMTNLNTSLSGTVGIHGSAREDLDSVLIELFSTFTISEIRVNGIASPFNRSNSALKIPVNLTSAENFEIEVDYAGTPPTAQTNPLGGSGLTNDVSPSWGNRITWSLSEPFSAYEWFPCKQSLKDKADSVDVNITVPSSCKAGSNGLLTQVVDLGNGTSRYEWKHRHPIDYYLISVAVGNYVDYSIYANPVGAPQAILIQNYIYDNPQTLPNFQADIDETADFIELFSEKFGMYPFADEKYGHCMAPLSGGMEHQTMTTQGFFTNTLTAHELAHQWFGDHVTCASWADIWVNEGFASYSEYLMLEALYPGDEVTDMADKHQNIMTQAGGSVWVADSLNEAAIFSSRLVYNKGAAIIHTLRFLLDNDEQFFQALKDFQLEFADSVALGTDILTKMEEISGKDLTAFFEEWYYGEGFPTYSATWNTVGSDVHLNVSHTSSKASVTPTFTNDLEIKFARSGQTDTTIRVAISSNSSNFILPNLGQVTQLKSIDPNNWVVNRVGSIVKDVNLNIVGISENTLAETMTVFPNPATDFVTISMAEKGNYTLRIIDPRGKVIQAIQFDQSIQWDVKKCASGIYLLQVETENGLIKSRRILKK